MQGELRGGHEAEKAPWAGGVWTPDRLLGLVPIGGAEWALKLGAGRGQRAALTKAPCWAPGEVRSSGW